MVIINNKKTNTSNNMHIQQHLQYLLANISTKSKCDVVLYSLKHKWCAPLGQALQCGLHWKPSWKLKNNHNNNQGNYLIRGGGETRHCFGFRVVAQTQERVAMPMNLSCQDNPVEVSVSLQLIKTLQREWQVNLKRLQPLVW